MTPVPPQKSNKMVLLDQHGTRTKIVEILASTANGCIAELGYHPSMSQALKELEQRNTSLEAGISAHTKGHGRHDDAKPCSATAGSSAFSLPPPTSGLRLLLPLSSLLNPRPTPSPMYQMSSFPQGSHPAQMQGQPRHPPHQAQTMQIQHSYVAKRSPPGGPIQIPPHYAHLVSSSYQRRSNDIHPTLVPLVATDKGQAAQTKEIRE
ncbi:hypothetical protein BDQ17DRAFT_1423389 [Cyathus striatus]|nr:hypothetical protein BDQ17DRAFT_1423389 [Cyathus striatus]